MFKMFVIFMDSKGPKYLSYRDVLWILIITIVLLF